MRSGNTTESGEANFVCRVPERGEEPNERSARSIGTHQVRELTVRRKEGPLLTRLATGDASSRLVEAYRLHPNAIKALARCGQGYSLSDEGLAPVVYPMMPSLSADYPLPRKDQKSARCLRLYETFVAG